MATTKVIFTSKPKDFDGTPVQVENFMNSITLYFFAYPSEFAKDERKVLYHLSKCKEGNTAIFARNYIAAKTTITPATANTPAQSVFRPGSYYNFENEFHTSFTDPNLMHNKRHLLDTMQQGNRTAKDFFNKFDLVRQQAGYGDAVTHVLYLISLLEKSALNLVLIQKKSIRPSLFLTPTLPSRLLPFNMTLSGIKPELSLPFNRASLSPNFLHQHQCQ